MATLQYYSAFNVTINGKTVSAGSLETPTSVTVGGQQHVQSFSVAQNTTSTVFDVDQDIADFDFAWIEADQNVFVETVVDDDGDVGEVASTVKLLAGIPFVLGTDDAKANYTVNFGGGTDDVIETVRVRNENATTANVYVYFFT